MSTVFCFHSQNVHFFCVHEKNVHLLLEAALIVCTQAGDATMASRHCGNKGGPTCESKFSFNFRP